MNDSAMQPNGQHIPAQDEIDLREVWEIIRRNRWLIASTVAAFVAAATAYIIIAMPVWEATTSLRIEEEETQSEMPTALTMLSALSGGSEVETEMQALRSRTLAAEVVDRLNLQLQVTEPDIPDRRILIAAADVDQTAPEAEYLLTRTDDGQIFVTNANTGTEIGTYPVGSRIRLDGAWITLTRGALREQEIAITILPYQEAVELLQEAISVSRPNVDANFVNVRYESTDTFLVRAVPNSLARRFIRRRQRVRRSEALGTVSFLNEQLDTIRTQLRTAENELQIFREAEGVVAAEAQATGQVERLIMLQARRNELSAKRTALAKLLEDVQAEAADETREPGEESPYRRLMAFPSLFQNRAAGQLLSLLAGLENQRAELLRVQTYNHPDVMVLTRRIRELEAQLRTTAVTYLKALTEELAAIDSALAGFQDQLQEIPAKQVRLARLMRQTKVLGEIYTLLQMRLKEAQIAAAAENPDIRIVDPAIQSIEPIEPRGILMLMFAVVLGGMTAVGIAFTREYMDTTVHTKEDVQGVTGLPVLGLIPTIKFAENGHPDNIPQRILHIGRNGRSKPARVAAHLITGHDPLNPVSESYRTLRTNITFSNPDRRLKTLVCTSALPGEGKTTSACNLAITMAEQDRRVLLIDADLRRGVLSEVFDIEREPGLLNVLFDQATFEQSVRQLKLGSGNALHILTTGTLPSNPAELLGAENTRAFVEMLEQMYDIVIFDAPPLNLVTDAAILGTNADGVIIIARANVTEKAALSHAIQELQYVRAPLTGVILNDINVNRLNYYGKYESFDYA